MEYESEKNWPSDIVYVVHILLKIQLHEKEQ